MIPSKEEMKEALRKRVGNETQKKFEAATVAICGLGGLGSNIAISLARAGVGRLILIDFDKVDLSNLNRQQYKASQIGMEKTKALEENLKEISPYIEIETYFEKAVEENYERLLKKADVICEAFDVAEAKSSLVNFVLENMPEKDLVAASGMAGLESGNTIQTRRLTRHFYLCGDGVSEVEEGEGLFAPRVMLCAAHQALTVLQILVGNFNS